MHAWQLNDNYCIIWHKFAGKASGEAGGADAVTTQLVLTASQTIHADNGG